MKSLFWGSQASQNPSENKSRTGSKTNPETVEKNCDFRVYFEKVFLAPQTVFEPILGLLAPRVAQDRPKTGPRQAKTGQDRPKTGLRQAQDSPRQTQDRPKTDPRQSQDRPRQAKTSPRQAQDSPRQAQDVTAESHCEKSNDANASAGGRSLLNSCNEKIKELRQI